ncbi:hypothetical protein CSIM01_07902 [Colletotrichum simmondsii]|uniref:Uncharacterized protein n=1 Tax=Colletotrichum simmondsii TaxID=703756 RepID=A0A135S5N3_9PEZI|nr:hypothetical protein CSIM01_07902 [Colletotrichum simmondsii]
MEGFLDGAASASGCMRGSSSNAGRRHSKNTWSGGLAIALGQAPSPVADSNATGFRCFLLSSDPDDLQRGGVKVFDGLDPISKLIVLHSGRPKMSSLRKIDPSPMVPARPVSAAGLDYRHVSLSVRHFKLNRIVSSNSRAQGSNNYPRVCIERTLIGALYLQRPSHFRNAAANAVPTAELLPEPILAVFESA